MWIHMYLLRRVQILLNEAGQRLDVVFREA
jgi:hypothetical protein